ncbi:ribosomal protein uS13 [Lyticum sinuosum]|uniref:Small ribosomal subunit protein uS13 n=1 Tax=Lyticum sinuosum TaxID=1332059 RepID=A0AAE4VJT9_9RICK|nr:30S ribosomal protein S13 [Lyticum sinuosum]MDZ5761226.1 30S ribosomal protein S13 [Lyticum sinuosum]
MARIAGITLPTNKKIKIALTYIKGIGEYTAKQICIKANINLESRVFNLTENEIFKIKSVIDQMCSSENKESSRHLLIEGDLVRYVQKKIQTLKSIRCYRGIRHSNKLPVRGQNTRNNARTRKGKAVPIAGKKKVAK